MSYYTSIVPAELVERLYEAGCPNIGRYEEADVFEDKGCKPGDYVHYAG